MVNYYVDFLKSFKAFVAKRFPDINHYQFNYSDKSYLVYKLYKKHVTEFPNCHINLTDIRINDDVNRAFFRAIANKFNDNTTQHICNNNTKQESVLLDFKWVNIQIDVKINVETGAEVFNYNHVLISNFPQNYMFYDYKYNAYIDLEDVSKNWEVTDVLENVVYRAVDGNVKKYALYSNEPIFKITNTSINKTVEGSVQNVGDGLTISFDVQLKVPNIIGKNKDTSRALEGIEIILNTGDYTDMPILIDMNNNVYSDNRNKASKIISLLKTEVDQTNGQIILNDRIRELLYDRHVAMFIVDDSTAPAKDVTTLWFELGFFAKDSLKDKTFIQLNDQYKNELLNINVSELSFMEILTFM